MRLRSLHRAYPSLHPLGVVHWVPEQLNIKAVTGACKLIDGCSLALCSTTVSVVSAGICHRNKVNSIAWLYRKAQPKDSIIYITLHLRQCLQNNSDFHMYVWRILLEESLRDILVENIRSRSKFSQVIFTNVLPDSYRFELLVKIAWTGSQDFVTGKNCVDKKPGLDLCYW